MSEQVLNISDRKLVLGVSDRELNELYQKVREIDDKYYLCERLVTTKKWFGVPRRRTSYFLYRIMDEAGVVKLANARDLKSRDLNGSYRFDSGLRHTKVKRINLLNSSKVSVKCFFEGYLAHFLEVEHHK